MKPFNFLLFLLEIIFVKFIFSFQFNKFVLIIFNSHTLLSDLLLLQTLYKLKLKNFFKFKKDLIICFLFKLVLLSILEGIKKTPFQTFDKPPLPTTIEPSTLRSGLNNLSNVYFSFKLLFGKSIKETLNLFSRAL